MKTFISTYSGVPFLIEARDAVLGGLTCEIHNPMCREAEHGFFDTPCGSFLLEKEDCDLSDDRSIQEAIDRFLPDHVDIEEDKPDPTKKWAEVLLSEYDKIISPNQLADWGNEVVYFLKEYLKKL